LDCLRFPWGRTIFSPGSISGQLTNALIYQRSVFV
jgi:hypothetical protein